MHPAAENRGLNLSDQKLANIKSPMFLKLEEMIQTVGMFKTEMIGTRVPKYEQRFIEKRRAD